MILSSNANNPYVVTDDIDLLLFKLLKNPSIKRVNKDFIQQIGSFIHESLTTIFDIIHIIEAERLQCFLKDQVRDSEKPVISLTGTIEREIVNDEILLSRSESINVLNGKCHYYYIGLAPRYIGCDTYKNQLKRLSKKFQGKEITLIDDVIFTGDTISALIDDLRILGLKVNTVIANVILEKAYDRLIEKNVNLIYDFKYQNVIDIICLRDFIFGIPGGGKNVIIDANTIAHAPYIFPFGNINKWASIPHEEAAKFSHKMLELSRDFWKMIDKENNIESNIMMLEKPPVVWHESTNLIVDGLSHIIDNELYSELLPIGLQRSSYDHAA